MEAEPHGPRSLLRHANLRAREDGRLPAELLNVADHHAAHLELPNGLDVVSVVHSVDDGGGAFFHCHISGKHAVQMKDATLSNGDVSGAEAVEADMVVQGQVTFDLSVLGAHVFLRIRLSRARSRETLMEAA